LIWLSAFIDWYLIYQCSSEMIKIRSSSLVLTKVPESTNP